MSRVCRVLQPAETSRRLLAAGGIALLLLLSLLSANPDLHRALHGSHLDAQADDCAVVLFAQGVTSPCDTAVLATTPADWSPLARPTTAEVFVASPRYLHVPGRGPPLS